MFRGILMNDRKKLKDVILMSLGSPMIDVELDDSQLELAIDLAIQVYRSKGANATEEAFLHLRMLRDESVYQLPDEVISVHKIYRSGNGIIGGGSASNVDPFALAYVNSYMLSAARGQAAGGLLTYDLYHQFDETVGRMFGREILFNYNRVTKKLVLERTVSHEETALLHVYHRRPESYLLNDDYIYPWIKDWALAESMHMLGLHRGKFQSLPGAQGQLTMDGPALQEKANKLKEDLLESLKKYGDGGMPLGFIIG